MLKFRSGLLEVDRRSRSVTINYGRTNLVEALPANWVSPLAGLREV